jgi:hypothetical protein
VVLPQPADRDAIVITFMGVAFPLETPNLR